ncbi:MAG: hemolysin family protein [Chloroflexi bacterium]|nr:hemolysin family protein [Chloroflexota bacterium]
MDIWLAWSIVVVSVIFHLITTLVLIAYPARNITFMSTSADTSNGYVDGEQIRQLDNRARVVFIGLQAASLVSGAFALAAALTTAESNSTFALVVGGLVAFAARFVVQGASSFVAHRYRVQTREFTSPVVWAVIHLTTLPGTGWLVTMITGRKPGDEAAGQEASEALREGLGLLEEAHIPAGESELQMIRGILRMDTVKVREIMRPRPDMVVASVEASSDEIMTQMTMGGHSKIPVYSESPDTIVGIVYARDLLVARANGEPETGLTRRLARPAIHVPESQNLERLLREFQEHRTSIAIVVDEYGGMAGLVTVTDLIEEIVGELVDEFDIEGPEVKHVSDDEIIADATMSIESLNRTMGTGIQAEGFDTIGGLIQKELGRIPVSGDSIVTFGLTITVMATVGRRITRVRVVRIPVPVAEG